MPYFPSFHPPRLTYFGQDAGSNGRGKVKKPSRLIRSQSTLYIAQNGKALEAHFRTYTTANFPPEIWKRGGEKASLGSCSRCTDFFCPFHFSNPCSSKKNSTQSRFLQAPADGLVMTLEGSEERGKKYFSSFFPSIFLGRQDRESGYRRIFFLPYALILGGSVQLPSNFPCPPPPPPDDDDAL